MNSTLLIYERRIIRTHMERYVITRRFKILSAQDGIAGVMTVFTDTIRVTSRT